MINEKHVETFSSHITEQSCILAKEGRKKQYEIGKKLHSLEFHDLHFSPNIVCVMKSRMRWEGQACGTKFIHTGFWWG
jgi:hypothetical protein